MSIVVFWVVTPCSLVVVANVSEERVASIFGTEVIGCSVEIVKNSGTVIIKLIIN
jgi:hypothetical protein